MIKKIFFLFFLPLCAVAAALPQQSAVPGGIFRTPVGDSKAPVPQVFYNGKRVLVMENAGQWLALVGIPLSAQPGQHKLTIKTQKGEYQAQFTVTDKIYPAQYITIKNQRMVNPNPDDIKRINADMIPINRALSTWTEQSDIEAEFIPPVDGRLSSLFGLKRFFNNVPKNPHSGLDIAAPAGTPIKAPGTARVINTGNYYYNGNTVFLDHGQGLVSGYFHMTEIKVKAGQRVKQGDVIGTVGETGRVTGPHLHWNVYLNETKVDPALFIADYIPVLDARNKENGKNPN
ncbi:MAG: peptidoglycan DD-metalloendopeptidase family protein [Gammaproteobacteria bacterium]